MQGHITIQEGLGNWLAQAPPRLASAHLPTVLLLLAMGSRGLPPHTNERFQDLARLEAPPTAVPCTQGELCLEKSLDLGIPEGEAAGQLGSAGSSSPRDTHKHR